MVGNCANLNAHMPATLTFVAIGDVDLHVECGAGVDAGGGCDEDKPQLIAQALQ